MQRRARAAAAGCSSVLNIAALAPAGLLDAAFLELGKHSSRALLQDATQPFSETGNGLYPVSLLLTPAAVY